MRTGRPPRPVRERFEEKYIIVESGCWEWQAGFFDERGYGKFWMNNKNRYAHRVSHELYIGDIPDGLIVCHRCDNPSCVNPKHFFLGTQQDNADDSIQKGRRPIAIHPSVASYENGCRCQECKAAQSQRGKDYYQRKKLERNS